MQPLDKIKEYSKSVCDQIRWKKTHSVISEEIENHLFDQRDAYMEDGAGEAEATDSAIIQMGDPVFIGTQLDRTHRPKAQLGMISLAAVLLLIGILIRKFILHRLTPVEVISLAFGLGLMVLAYFTDFTLVGRYPRTIYFAILALSIATTIISPVVRGRTYYTAFVTLLFPLGFAAIVYRMRNKSYPGIILCGFSFLLPACITLYIPTLSGFFIFAVTGLVIICIAIGKEWFKVNKLYGYLLVFIPTAASMLASFVLAGNRMRRRLLFAINPAIDPSGYIYRLFRAFISGASMFGKGDIPAEYAESAIYVQKAIIETDFLLAYLIYNFGWITFIIIMGVLLFFIIKGYMLCFRQKSYLGLFVSLSIMLTFTLQVIGYVIFNLGYPIFGPLSLPLISYGKIASIINLFLIGIMLSVFRTGEIIKDRHLQMNLKID